MKIGYLHLNVHQPDVAESGVTRYGRTLASSVKTKEGVTVTEVTVNLHKKLTRDFILINQALQQLNKTDYLHLNYSKSAWGTLGQLYYLILILLNYKNPFIVTLHDVYKYLYSSDYLWKKISLKSLSAYILNNLPLKLIFKHAKFVVVNNQQEWEVIQHRCPPEKLKIINLCVEVRNITLTPTEARESLGLANYKIITLLGFIYASKGYQLLIDAIPHLPPNVRVVFAGGPSPKNEQFLESLRQQAETLGIEKQLIITGYLSESDLECYLMATHLAICPFKNMSASASVSTWISVGKPILASNLPQMQAYNNLEPGAINIFDSYDAVTLATAIQELLSQSGNEIPPPLLKLREKLLLPRIRDEYLELLH